jgi:hypothetical protein
MTNNDLPTVGYLDQWFRALLSRVERPGGQAAAPAEVVLYSVQGLAQVLGCNPGTVRCWLKVGKPSRDDPANPSATSSWRPSTSTSRPAFPGRQCWPMRPARPLTCPRCPRPRPRRLGLARWPRCRRGRVGQGRSRTCGLPPSPLISCYFQAFYARCEILAHPVCQFRSAGP